MALYLAIVLLGLLIGFGGGLSEREELLLLWGTSVGLALAHLFAFRLTHAFAKGWEVTAEGARAVLGVAVAVVGITGIASLPYLLDITNLDSADVATALLMGVIGVTGYASARRSGAKPLPAIVFAAAILLVAAVVVTIKYTLSH